MNRAVVIGLAALLASTQVISARAAAVEDLRGSRRTLTVEDDGYTHTNIDAFNKYSGYFYFADDNVRVGVGDTAIVNYTLDADGFDDLSLFTINVGDSSIATVSNATLRKCEVQAVSKGSTLVTGYYNGVAIASVKITVVDNLGEGTQDGDESGVGIGGGESDGSDSNEGSGGVNVGTGSDSAGGDDSSTNTGGVNIGTSEGDVDSGKDNFSSGSTDSGISTGSGTPGTSSGVGITDDADYYDNDSYGLSTAVFFFNKTSVTLEKGNSATIKYTLKEGKASDLKFSVKNSKVASVKSGSGSVTIKGLAAGTTTLVVTKSNGAQYKSTLTVKVVDYATKVKLNKTTLSLAKKGKTGTLKVAATSGTLHPKATYKWSSSKTKVAKVSQKGVVTAVAKGTATVTVKYTATVRGKKVTSSAKCKVTVKA